MSAQAPPADLSSAVARRGDPGVGVSSAFGTFGELLQGVLPGEGTDFLVTLPIARWTTATFELDPDVPGVRVRPGHKHKALRLARAMLTAAGYRGGGTIVLESCLPEGKGLASSSADLVATARAIANVLGTDLPPQAVEAFLRPIEPTDGVMYDGVVAFEHRRVRLRGRLGSLPPTTIVSLDEGGVVDTIAFNRRAKPFDAADEREYGRLLDELSRAVCAGDLPSVGRVATRSAELNQRLQPKRSFERLRSLCADIDALGVAVAHSGTAVGLLLADADSDYGRKRAAAERACLAEAGNVAVYHTLPSDPSRTG